MPRRIDIELTSARDDGTWTWRAAGAREPKGTVAAAVLPTASKVGDVLKVDAEFFVDGIEITAVVPTKDARKEPERLELLGQATADEPLVTTTLAPRREDRGPRRGRGPRRDGDTRDRDRDRDRRPREPRERRDGDDRGGERRGGERPARRTRPEPPPVPTVERPKAKRLRAAKVHRTALLESLPEEQRPVAEQLLLGGLPAVRQAIEKQNAERAAAGESAIAPGPLVDMAEKLAPKVRAAEWRDRAEAAKKDLEQLDLRDLRSVVSAAGDAGKDPEARALADELKAGLAGRVDAEHALWIEELTATVDVGRVVRALRLSSRPPKAGSPLPAELSARLVASAGEALAADASGERWIAVLDALAFSPVRDKVIPASLPSELPDDVRATIARLATRIPKIAHIFEIEPDRSAPRPKVERRRPAKKKPAGGGRGGKAPASPAPETAAASGPEEPVASAPEPEASPAAPEAPEAPAAEASPTAPEAPDVEAVPGEPEAPATPAATVDAPSPAETEGTSAEPAPAEPSDVEAAAPGETAPPADAPGTGPPAQG
jgi:hypothetical protein